MIFFASVSITFAATTYYVAANGNDTWSGLLPAPNATNTDGPFRTLQKAQSAMRSSSIKTTTIRGGTYPIAGTYLRFDYYASDSGETWIPYQNETVTIDGGGTGYITGNAGNVTIEGLTFQSFGADSNGGALDWGTSGGLPGPVIRWNTFINCKVSCINGMPVGAYIDSNTINGAGAGGFHGAMTFWYGASNNKITHNLIQNSAEEGVDISTGSSDPAASNNLIDRNVFRNVCSNTKDCGAAYIYDASHKGVGNQIMNNIIDGNGGYTTGTTAKIDNWTKAVYLDDGTSNVLVSGNICRGCGEYGLQIHGGDHNTFKNNIFDLSAGGSEIGFYQNSTTNFGMTGNSFIHNIVYSSGAFHNPLWSVGVTATDADPTDNTNLYYSGTNASIPNTNIIDTNPVYANPQFSSPSTGNYSMPASSPAYTRIGWQTLPTDQGPLANPLMTPPPPLRLRHLRPIPPR